MVSDRFRGPHVGAIFGVSQVGRSLGTALGPCLAGWIFDATGSYAIPSNRGARLVARRRSTTYHLGVSSRQKLVSLPGWVVLVRLSVLAGLLTSACETAMYSMEWAKPGMDAQQYRRDAYECQRVATMSRTADAYAGSSMRRMYMRCMESRGYTLVE
jgi:MFS family permease